MFTTIETHRRFEHFTQSFTTPLLTPNSGVTCMQSLSKVCRPAKHFRVTNNSRKILNIQEQPKHIMPVRKQSSQQCFLHKPFLVAQRQASMLSSLWALNLWHGLATSNKDCTVVIKQHSAFTLYFSFFNVLAFQLFFYLFPPFTFSQKVEVVYKF